MNTGKQLNGVICINKDEGYTSQDVVSVVRGILRVKKAGHTGTLDPIARGVLPVCIGAATKAASFISADRKTYEAVMRLGVTTDTYDMTGNITGQSGDIPDEKTVRETVMSFRGELSQRPPLFSAVHINGKRAYELARRGEKADMPVRRVTVFAIEILSVDLPGLSFSVTCSAGTYIRSLINDIGQALGCGAAMEALTRTACGGFTIDRSCTLGELEKLRDEDRAGEALMPLGDVFAGLKRFELSSAEYRIKAMNGNPLPLPPDLRNGEFIFVHDGEGFFYGIYRADAGSGRLMPEKMFLTEGF